MVDILVKFMYLILLINQMFLCYSFLTQVMLLQIAYSKLVLNGCRIDDSKY